MPPPKRHRKISKNKLKRKSWTLFQKIDVLTWLREKKVNNNKISCVDAVKEFSDWDLGARVQFNNGKKKD